MTHLSLFSGVAGIDLAAHWAGFETVQFVERDQFCQKVLAKNFPGVPIHDDVTTFDGNRCRGVDLVSAGFPCQPHSLAGKRLASGDERDLWGEVVRILGEAKPQWFLGENVPGLLTSESGRFFGRVVDDLATLGFSVGWCCYGACDVGAVHRRKRVFIVAYAKEQFSNVRNDQSSGTPVSELGDSDCSGDATDTSGEGLEGQGQRRAVACCNATDSNINRFKTLHGRGTLPDQNWISKSSHQGWEVQQPGSGSNIEILADPQDFSGSQTSEAVESIGSGWLSRSYVGGSDWERIGRGDWKRWGIEPVLCRGDDDVPDRVARLKALGNAVVPAQAYPILKAIAEASA